MTPITGTWTNGQILLAGPGDWPEGIEVMIAPVADVIGLNGAQRSDDPESIEAWAKAVDSISPMEWAPGELESLETHQEKLRERNKEAVARQMAEIGMAVQAVSGDVTMAT